MIDQVIQLFFIDGLTAFLDPQKRIFWGYLLSSLIIALSWFSFYKRSSLKQSINYLFPASIWISSSARADYLLMIINGAVMTLLSPLLLGKITVATLLFTGLHQLFEGRALITMDIPDGLIAIAFTLFLFIFDDFARYWLHRWLHTYPTLWSFHKVHHSATTLNPFTVFRSHPIEGILFSIRGTLVQGISVAVFIYFFGNQVTLVSVLGASIFTFLFNLLGSNLRHTTVSIGYKKSIERIFMSPAQHQIHHSYAPEHIDKNYGVALSIWDYLFKTHCFSKKDQTLLYGLSKYPIDNQHTLKMLYLTPFIEVSSMVWTPPLTK